MGGYARDGGGGGGGILLNVGTLSGKGTIEANGGNGTTYWASGGGGGGRVAVYTWGALSLPLENVTAVGGVGNDDGGDGSVHVSDALYFTWSGPADDLFHGVEHLSWHGLGLDPGEGYTADVRAFRHGEVYAIGDELPLHGRLEWDTSSVPDGWYELCVAFYDDGGRSIGEASRQVLLNNSVTWHAGHLAVSETWAASDIHVVEAPVRIKSGVTLTLEAGTIVKFAHDTSLLVDTDAVLEAPAEAALPIVLTSLLDDAGGDTNLDGSTTVPTPGGWAGIATQGTGQANLNEFVDLRYMVVSHAGTLSGSETWDGGLVHRITSDVTVPGGATLTIEPGAVIKLDVGRSLLVEAGATLKAEGNVAQPIVFTSIRDDSVGGDTNRDGDTTSAAAGDWYRILVDGGTASLDHVRVRYGAGKDRTHGALLRSDGAATLTVANSALTDGFYTGLLAWGGSVTVTNTVVAANDRGISAHPDSTVDVVNCTVDRNRINLLIHYGTLNACNTLVTNHLESGFDYDAGTIGTLRHNDVWSPEAGSVDYRDMTDMTGTDGSISVDPGYKDPEGANYRLQYLSPAIDAADGGLAPETDFMGAPRYDDPRTPNAGLPTAEGAYADMGAFEFVETADSTIDLVVTEVQGPLAATAGQSVTVTWTVANRGSDPAVGPWHDSLFLEREGETLLAGETLVAEGVTLAPGEGQAFQAQVRVPGGVVASYHWQVTTNTGGEVFEGHNTDNNRGTSTTRVALDLPALIVDGTPLSEQFTAVGESHWYKLEPALNQDILVSLDGGGGAAELYLGRGRMPTRQAFDTRSTEWNSPDATVAVENAWPETYYVLAYARSLPGAVAFSLGAEALDVGVDSVEPSVVGNAGPSTLKLRGAGLGADATYALLAPAGGILGPSDVHWESSTTVYVTFDLTEAAAGLYDVRVTLPGGGSYSQVDAVDVQVGSGPHLVTELTVPDVTRAGRPFFGTIRYENTGDADLAAPLLFLSSGGQAGMRLSSRGGFETDVLQLIGAAPEGPAGILRPGQRGEIVFSAKGYVWSDNHVDFALSYDTEASSGLVDWDAFEMQAVPDDLPPEEWDQTWDAFTAQCGATWGGYAATLARYATLMRQRTGDPLDLPAVFDLAIREMHRQLFTNVGGVAYLEDASHPLGGAGVMLSGSDPEETGYWQTGDDGAFYADLAPGVYTVTVHGYVVQEPLTVTVPETGSLNGLSVFVESGGSLAGRIARFGSETPLDGVLVQAARAEHQVYVGGSDESGYYRVDGLLPGEYTVTAGGRDWGPVVREGLQVDEGLMVDGVDFALDPAVILSGCVTSVSDTTPISGAVIILQDRWGRPSAGTTNATGCYTVPHLATGPHSVRVEAAGYAPLGPEELVVPRDTVEWVRDFSMYDGAMVQVTARDAATSAPLEDAMVILSRGATTETVAYEATGADGRAVLADLAAGEYVLSVEMEARWTITEALTVSVGQTVTREYALHQAGVISGHVTAAGGEVLADVPLQLLRQDGALALGFSDADGSYAFTGVPQGTYAVSLWGGQCRQEVAIDGTSWEQMVDFVLPGVSLSGRVVAADGATPVENTNVSLLKGDGFVAAAVTEDDGDYHFVTVMPGEYTLVAGGPEGLTAHQAVTVGGSGVSVPDMRMGGVALTGHVRDAQGNPLAGAAVSIQFPEGEGHLSPYFATMTGQDGGFELGGLVAGTYALQVYLRGHAVFRQDVAVSEPGPAQVEVVLGTGHGISGQVSSVAAGEPLVGARVVVYEADSGRMVNSDTSGLDGTYSVPDLPDGTYDLTVSYPGHQQAEAVGCLIEGASLTRDLELLPQIIELEGQVVDDVGRPVPEALVSVRNSRGEVVAYATTAYDGSYRFEELPGGAYVLGAAAYGFSPAELSGVILSHGQTVDVDLTVTPAAMSGQKTLTAVMRALAESAPLTRRRVPGPSYTWLYPLTDYLTKNNPEPTRIQGDSANQPPLPDFDCWQAGDEASAAWEAIRHKDSAFEAWQSAHSNYDTTVSTSLSVFALQFAKLSGSIASLCLPSSATSDFLNQYGATGFAIYQTAPIMASLYSTLSSFELDTSSGPAILNSFSGLFSDINSISSAGVTVWDLLDEASQISTLPFGLISAAFDTLSLIQTTHDSWQAFENASGTVTAAQDNYFKAYHDMMRRLRALEEANSDCPNPEPDTPAGGEEEGDSDGTDIAGALDPNDKTTIGFGVPGFVAPETELLYTIYFENVPTATAAAQQVFITDTLSPDLDWSSFELLSTGFNDTEVSMPSGLAEFEGWAEVASDPNPVRVQAGLNADTGVFDVGIASVDPHTGHLPQDPWAGFLPPNDETGRGEGFISFRVRPASGLTNGHVITNQARIVFDVNPPIDTPVVTNTIDAEAPTSSVDPLPETSPEVFTVSWTGDDGSGSGVAFYDVYVSIDGGDFELWKASIAETQAAFAGEDGHTYGFYSVATDNVGHVEGAPTEPDATTVARDGHAIFLPLVIRNG